MPFVIPPEKAKKLLTQHRKNLFFLVDAAVTDVMDLISDNYPRFEFHSDRHSNDTDTYYDVVLTMTKHCADKKTLLVAVGGGILRDLAGFVAATFMQGMDWIYVPTTTIGMIDGTVGGRSRLRFEGRIGLIGVNCRPLHIVEDHRLLLSQPDAARSGGLCRIVGIAVTSKKLFKWLEKNIDGLVSGDEQIFSEAVVMCRKTLGRLLTGNRKALKVGTVFGEAFRLQGGERRNFGEYALFGMIIENELFKSDINMQFYDSLAAIIDKLPTAPLDFSVENTIKYCFAGSKDGTVKISVAIRPGRIIYKRADETAALMTLNQFKR